MAVVTNKIGLHTGEGGDHERLKAYFSELDAAKIPFVIKSVDDYQPIEMGLGFNQAEHVFVFRLSTIGQDNEAEFDVPLTDRSPSDAATIHWNELVSLLPENFDRERVWLEPIITPDPDMIDWMGQFAVAYAEIALREGIKLLMFSWNTSTPALGDWQQESMLSYLRMCAEYPNQLGVALKEFSFDSNNIWTERGFRVGYFNHLFDACDLNGIPRPTVVMTEWGWSSVDMPDAEAALEQIREVNEFYGQYPEILGAALWRLGSGSKSLSKQVERLLPLLTRFSTQWSADIEPDLSVSDITLSVEIDPRPILTPDPTAEAAIETEEADFGTLSGAESTTGVRSNLRYVADVTIPDHSPIPAGQSFIKTWRVRNSGDGTWGPDHRLVFLRGNQMSAADSVGVPRILPNGVGEISVEMVAPRDVRGRTFGDWQMVDPLGNRVGDVLYLILDVKEPIPDDTGTDDSKYRADVTIPDDTRFSPGKRFTKTWRIRNTGDTHWGDGYTFGHIGGPQLADSKSVSLPPCAPGQNVDVSVEMTAPSVPGTYRSEWRPKNRDGEFFGEFVFVQIVVPEPVSQSPVPNFSQIDPRWKSKTLGTRHSDVTIGDWGCLMTCLTMVANYYGKSHTPESMVDRMLDKGLFIDAKKTPFRLLDNLYTDVIYEGRLESRANPNIAQRIDAALAAGNPVTAHVDVTPNSAYTPNDQHWVLIVGKEGNDYRIHDPLVHPATEISLREKYSKPREALNQTIRAAIFYRSQRPMPSLFGSPGVLAAESIAEDDLIEEPIILPPLQTGMNINPDAPHSDPRDSKVLKGMNWVRFVFKIDAQPDPNMRNLKAAMKKYADLIQDYKRQGIKSLIVLNQETVWGSAPWATGASWETYAKELARVSEQIARRFKRLGDGVAYEIWNEGDAEGHASIFVPPADFAHVLDQTAKGVKRGSPNSPIIFGGLMGGPGTGIPYVKGVQDALGGTLPIDALGIHPYGKWGSKAPFDWGNKFGTLAEEFEQYAEAFPGLKLWITEMGVANASPLGPETYRDTAMYLEDVYAHISERYVEQVPVVIWFAWSDLMRNAGIVKMNGDKKNHVFTAFERVRDRLVF